MRNLRSAFAVAFAAGAIFVGSPALAHAKLVNSNPAANATVRAAPKTITLTFNERVVPAFSKFTVTMPDHNNMAVPVETTVSRDRKRIVGTFKNPLGTGAYKVTWTAAGSDGHKMSGDYSFRVG